MTTFVDSGLIMMLRHHSRFSILLHFPSPPFLGILPTLIFRTHKARGEHKFTIGAMSWASQAHTHTLSDLDGHETKAYGLTVSRERRLAGYEWIRMRMVHGDTGVHFAF